MILVLSLMFDFKVLFINELKYPQQRLTVGVVLAK